jgi:hypothetical protein
MFRVYVAICGSSAAFPFKVRELDFGMNARKVKQNHKKIMENDI